MSAAISGFACGNSVAGLLQRLLRGSASSTALAGPPIFVIGHWRSGTTWMHELLDADSRHTAPNTYECMSPAHFLLTETFVSRWLPFVLPNRRLPDRMAQSWLAPQEDEAAMCNLGMPSPYWKLAFPNQPMAADDYVDMEQLPEARRQEWCELLERFLRQVSSRRPQRLVLKSPTHSLRIPLLADHFGGSRYVYMVRDPQRVIPSTLHLWRVMRRSQGLQAARFDSLEDEVFGMFHRLDRAVESARQTLPRDRFATVRYEQLKADPLGELERLYEQLEFGDFAAARDNLVAHLAQVRDHQVNHYEPDPALEDRIRNECAEFSTRHGYDQPQPATTAVD
jgi:hypothetical protein